MENQDIIFGRIKSDFSLLSKVVVKQLSLSKALFLEENSSKLLSDIVSNEGIIDSFEVKLRSEVINAIVLYAPRAIDLRKIIAYYDMTAYLERIGDHLLNISEELATINKNGIIFVSNLALIQELFNTVELMTHNALIAFECEDNLLAKKIIADDDKADSLNIQIMSQLTIVQENNILTSNEISDILQIGGLAGNLERIGDNATNIAESAIYLTEGRDIKHHD